MVTQEVGNLASLLFGKTRRTLLALFFTRPDESFYMRQIIRDTACGTGPVQRELEKLTGAGLLSRTQKGPLVYFQANAQCPIYEEIRAMIVKTIGIGNVLRHALAALRGKILLAFVFGSFARGQQDRASDVDLMVVTNELELADLVGALRDAQRTLAREINPIVYSPAEFQEKWERGHHFLHHVMSSEKIMIYGNEDELAGLGKKRLAAATYANSVGNSGPVRRRRSRSA